MGHSPSHLREILSVHHDVLTGRPRHAAFTSLGRNGVCLHPDMKPNCQVNVMGKICS